MQDNLWPTVHLVQGGSIEVCGLEFLEDRRQGHCQRFAEGLAKSESAKVVIPPSRLGAHGRTRQF